MINEILEFFKEFNIQTIISIAVIMWYFTRDIKSSIETLDHDLRKMNTRVSRLEGTVFGREIYNKIDE